MSPNRENLKADFLIATQTPRSSTVARNSGRDNAPTSTNALCAVQRHVRALSQGLPLLRARRHLKVELARGLTIRRNRGRAKWFLPSDLAKVKENGVFGVYWLRDDWSHSSCIQHLRIARKIIVVPARTCFSLSPETAPCSAWGCFPMARRGPMRSANNMAPTDGRSDSRRRAERRRSRQKT